MFIEKKIKLERKQTADYRRVGSTFDGVAYNVTLDGKTIGTYKRIRVGDKYSTQSKWNWEAAQDAGIEAHALHAVIPVKCPHEKLFAIDKWLAAEITCLLVKHEEDLKPVEEDAEVDYSRPLGGADGLAPQAALIAARKKYAGKMTVADAVAMLEAVERFCGTSIDPEDDMDLWDAAAGDTLRANQTVREAAERIFNC